MQKQNVQEWWKDIGCIELNRVLIDIVGSGIGFVPVANLLGDVIDISVFDQDELMELLIKDGCYLRTQLMTNGQTMVLIYVK